MRSFSLSGAPLCVALCIAQALGCANNVGDQECTPDSVPTDVEDDCPYGPPGGPKVTEQGDCDIAQTSDKASCDTDWVNDIYPILTDKAVNTFANCAGSSCHGLAPAGVGGLFLGTNAADAFDVLKAYNGTANYPYINTEDPQHSWILCNLKGQAGGGVPMPPPGMDDKQLETVAKWAACGLELNLK